MEHSTEIVQNAVAKQKENFKKHLRTTFLNIYKDPEITYNIKLFNI